MIPLAEIGTDRHRLDMWTKEAADNYNDYADGYDFDFKRFRKTDGYAPSPMDGVWLRAPYLHNGSVPTRGGPAQARRRAPEGLLPRLRRRASGQARASSAWARRPAEEGFRYDTRVAGNSNQGHEGSAYGTTLPEADKRALVEYLKTR